MSKFKRTSLSKALGFILITILFSHQAESKLEFWPFPQQANEWESNATTLIPLLQTSPLRFVSKVSLGNPPQQFKLLVDTLNSVFWVYSNSCYYSYVCWQRQTYSHSSSSDYRPVGTTQQLNYPYSADMSGYLSSDVVQLSGFQSNFTFAEITSISIRRSEDNILFDEIDGMMPLGWQQGAKVEIPTIFQALRDKYPNVGDSYSLYFGHSSQPNYLILGGTDSHYYTGKIQYHQLLADYGWAIQLNGITISNNEDNSLKSHDLHFGFAKSALIMSGTPYIYGPSQDMDKIVQHIKVDKDCSNINDLPNISLKIENIDYVLTPFDYVIENDDAQGGSIFGSYGISVRTCEIALRSSQTNPLFLLGSSFIRAYYSHFDFQKKRVGFAKAKRFN